MLREIVVEPLSGQIEAFGKAMFSNLSGFCLKTLGAFIGIWMAYVAYKAIAEGEFNVSQIMNKVVLFTILVSLLSVNNAIFYKYIYEPIKNTTNGIVSKTLSISPSIKGEKFNNSNEAIDKLEWTFKELIDFVGKVVDKGGITAVFSSAIIVGILTFVFVMSEMLYALFVLGNTMKLTAIGALSPLLIVAFAFPKTRGHVIGALQYLLSSALTLIIASFCVGMLLFVLRKFQASCDLNSINKQDVHNMLNALFVLACLSVFFLMLAPGIAAAISGARSDTALTGIAAAAMSGGLAFISSKLGMGAIKGVGASNISKLVGQSSKTSKASSNRFSNNYTPRKTP